jgi:hypothetical protein
MHRSPEKASDALALVKKLLEAGQPLEAAEIVNKHGSNAPELRNAYGVALLRSGQTAKALEVYRGLCLHESGLCLKPGLTPALKANYATALLLAKNVGGSVAVLREIDSPQHPYVQKLRAAIYHWRRSLGWWQRLAFDWYGAEPDQPVTLDFPPGELLDEAELRPAA